MKKLLLLWAVMMAMTASADITPTESQMWWGYFSDNDAAALNYDKDALGSVGPSTLDVCIYVPAGTALVGSSSIKAVRFWLGDDVSKVSADIKVWVSKTLPDDISKCDRVQALAKDALVKGLNELMLDTPYEVGNEDVYVGYTVTFNVGAYPILCRGTDIVNAFLIRSRSNWENLYGNDYGNLAIQMLLEGGTYPDNCMTAADFGQIVTKRGQSLKVPVTFINSGKNVIESFSYTVTTVDSDAAEEEQTVRLSTPLSFNASSTIKVTMPANNGNKKYVKQVNITKVNGVPNTAENNTAKGYVIYMAESLPVTPVVEEFTGTWCGYCPYGTVGMQKTHDKYGDKVVLIAAHSGDAMAIQDYAPVISAYVGNYPSSVVDRITSIYPYYLVNTVGTAMGRVTQGTIALKATWANSEKTMVDFNTKTTFGYNDENGQYGIAFALVEDGLKGSGSSWNQSNFLSGQSGEADMAFWYSAPSSVSGLTYDHVVVAAWEALDGIDGSVQPSFASGEALEFSFKGDITSKTLIQDKTQLTAVALLIDRLSGAIVNAAQAVIGESESEAVSSVTASECQSVTRYTIDGRMMQAPSHGLNIEKRADGTVRKVMVK